MPAENGTGSDMPSVGAAPGHKRLNNEGPSGPPESKRQQTEPSDDESTVIGDDNVADMEDVDEDGFKVVRHRKGRTVGVPVLITATEQGRDLRQVNPITLYSDIEGLLGAAPIRSRFTVQGALLLDVQTEKQANTLLQCKTISNIAVNARVPNAYLKNTCVIRGVPKWYSDQELMAFLRPQGVFSARRMIRRIQTNSTWESRRTDSVVLTFAPNTERPEEINLGFTLHKVIDHVEVPPRCFKCQRFGHVAKHCTAEQRCKRCGGPHNFKTCDRTEGFLCANCGGNHPASYSRCPIRSAALERKKRFIAGPKSHRDSSSEKEAANSPKEGSRFDYTRDFPRLKLLDNTSNISAKTVKKSVTTANQKAIPKRNSQLALENTTTFVDAPVAPTSTEAVASDSVSPRSSNRPYASTLSPTRATTEASHSSSSDCDQVLRALFMALRSHIARMPESSAKELLQVVLALESVILSAASSH
ncbi:hypothetical protein HPB50_016671 [Hyalomma asiaticum]|uniref:Uncharacterized protein n=1 Tax=Hyalomma asiaticum TaxID=266040 RepID=A0ACB7RMC4_HYAAI|nr:hypothetical protein HPB50_016671 [Hyalomma asiaticum]